MSHNKTILERLERDLNDRDAANQELQEQIAAQKAYATWEWARHTVIENDPLPAPRLEMVAHNTSGDWYVTEWIYSLVYVHLLGHNVRVPLGSTRQTGGRGIRDVTDVPFRDGAHFRHDAKALNLPAYIIIGDHIEVQP